MANNNVTIKQPKHLGTFWPLLIILVVTLVLGGTILYFANNNIVQDEIYASSFFSPNLFKKIPRKNTTPNAVIQKSAVTK